LTITQNVSKLHAFLPINVKKQELSPIRPQIT
jgi:hypothetical protein